MKALTTLLLALSLILLIGVANAQPYYAPGDYYSPVWGDPPSVAPEMKDDGTGGDATPGDGIYSVLVNVATAGVYQWKVAQSLWSDPNWPNSNCWFVTSADNEDVLLTFNTNSIGDGWAPDSFWPHSDHTFRDSYKVVGSLQDELGDAFDWDPVGGGLYLHDDGLNGDPFAGDGFYTYVGNVSTAGNHEWKIAVNDSWDQQFGTDGPSINAGGWFIDVLNNGDTWYFVLDLNTGRVLATQDDTVYSENNTWGAVKSLYQ